MNTEIIEQGEAIREEDSDLLVIEKLIQGQNSKEKQSEERILIEF